MSLQQRQVYQETLISNSTDLGRSDLRGEDDICELFWIQISKVDKQWGKIFRCYDE